MRHMLNAMRREASAVLGDVAFTSAGIIRSYDPANYAVRVELQPQGTLTGWIPLSTPWVGNGWGMFCAPSIGDLVEVTFLNGDIDSGVAGLRLYNEQDRPLNVPSGEFWLRHNSGASFKFTNDGKCLVNSQLEIDATAPVINLNAAMAVNVTAPSISIGAAGQAVKSFITETFISFFNNHTHPTNGAVPSQIMTAATHATSTVKGG